MVSGATSGIGLETALTLAHSGANVIIVGRNERKCINTVNKIERETGNSSIDFLIADLSIKSELHPQVSDRLDLSFQNFPREPKRWDSIA